MFNPKFLLHDLKEGFAAAQARAGHEGGLMALSAGGLLLAFIALALLAPFAIQAPGLVSYGLGVLIVILIVAATATGAFALWRLMIGAPMQAGDKANLTGFAPYNPNAVLAALSDAEDAGLSPSGRRQFFDALTGRVQGYSMAAFQVDHDVFLVIRLKETLKSSFIFAPKSVPWPYPLPKGGPLTPVPPPGGVNGLAWSNNRDFGLKWTKRLGPAMAMSEAGGEAPFLSLRQKALVLRWSAGDVGTASLIGRELIGAIARRDDCLPQPNLSTDALI
ncbi:hypothetical protein [Candidatus Phycosocius spiralis]|nr:hypothetical protein [Candidatus Phycosocius spiralis]